MDTNLIISEKVPSKQEQDLVAFNIVSLVKNGEADPVKVHVTIKALENIISAIKENEDYKRLSIEAVKQYDKQTFLGAFLEIKHRTLYKYDHDPVWRKLDADKKAREKLLKAIPLGKQMCDPDNGELMETAISGQTEYIQVNFDKEQNSEKY